MMTNRSELIGTPPDRDEAVEQAYFFRVFRERLADNVAAQDILIDLKNELLTTTRLPWAVDFLLMELKHSGLLGTGFAKLPHYFTPFQAFVIAQAEDERRRITIPIALLVLEREATYKSDSPSPEGLFVYQFETIARNRLGYDKGLTAVATDPFYGPAWRDYIEFVRKQGGVIDFCDLVYVRSELYVREQRHDNPDYHPSVPVLFGEKEGKIAKASRGRDPLYLFAALQRQLGYPEIPKPKREDDIHSKLLSYDTKIRELEVRIRMLEAEQRGTFDPTQFARPEISSNISDDDES
jgi:hypothetical protein